MSIEAKYKAQEIEQKWYNEWMDKDLFHSKPDDRESYSIVIPPPNVTGILHMGHMLNNTIQDILVRRARMMGKNACWVPGTDHASIATEAKVVAKLKEDGIDKNTLSREEFMEHAWQWKEKHGGIILEQLKKLGCSCDWKRTSFTMDSSLYESVIDIFIDLYKKGLIYRGIRMVNWDTKALTALSDEEVIFKQQDSKLYYLRYKIEETEDYIVVATTRPETILGDTAVCIHPLDNRYSHLKGKRVYIPTIDRLVPIIEDEYVDMSFGTGCLKITPAHDINDYSIGLKHNLDSIDIFNDNGTLNSFGLKYEGLDRFECRKKIVEDIQDANLMEKEENYINNIGFSERTDVIIEPKISTQWFLKMEDFAGDALRVVEDDIIAFHPQKFKNTYRYWLENVKDWCISRQLWWGQRIPAYYLPNREIIVAKSLEKAFEEAKIKYPNENIKIEDIRQDDDVLDTWFSSWLWPITVFDGVRQPNNEEINYYYPTNDLVTAPDILFFWVARMIMAGLEYRKEIPFKNVYFTGTVRDSLGRKMSKSLGNSPDPIELIEKYGADGVRMGMLLSSPAGNDLLFEESSCEQGRNFSNKIWNALRLVKGWQVEDIEQPLHSKSAIAWFGEKLNKSLKEIDDDFSKYRLSESLMTTYKLIWDDFCSWLLEIVKPEYQKPIDATTYNEIIELFEILIKLLHPYMPFITEEIYHNLKTRKEDDYIMISELPKFRTSDNKILSDFAYMQEKIIAIRQFRNEKNIAQKQALELFIKEQKQEFVGYDNIIKKLCNLSSIEYVKDKKEGMLSLMVRTTEMFIPLLQSINKEEEISKLQENLKYYEGFKNSVEKKLSNERFVSGAPEAVVENEKNKLSDTIQKINSINEQLNLLKE